MQILWCIICYKPMYHNQQISNYTIVVTNNWTYLRSSPFTIGLQIRNLTKRAPKKKFQITMVTGVPCIWLKTIICSMSEILNHYYYYYHPNKVITQVKSLYLCCNERLNTYTTQNSTYTILLTIQHRLGKHHM